MGLDWFGYIFVSRNTSLGAFQSVTCHLLTCFCPSQTALGSRTFASKSCKHCGWTMASWQPKKGWFVGMFEVKTTNWNHQSSTSITASLDSGVVFLQSSMPGTLVLFWRTRPRSVGALWIQQMHERGRVHKISDSILVESSDEGVDQKILKILPKRPD